MKSSVNKPTKAQDPEIQHETAFDKIEAMWDRELAKGDEDFYENFRATTATAENKNKSSVEQPPRTRKKGRGI